jgi:VWFA-related protein
MRKALSWLGTLFLALPVAAQTGSVTRSVNVSVTNVDVVVTDSAGKPITDLSSADFEVRQDGKLQPITNFSFIRNTSPPPTAPPAAMPEAAGPTVAPAEPAPPPAARAHLIVFLDELHLTTINRNRALRSLREYLPTVVGPNVEVQLVTWDRALRIRGPFTNDKPVLGSMLSQLETEVALGDIPVRQRTDLLRQIDQAYLADPRTTNELLKNIVSETRGWADSLAADVDATADAVRVALSSVAGVEGRKVFFFVTERFSPYPARDMFEYLQYGRMSAGTGGRTNLRDVNDLTWKDWDRMSAFRSITAAANVAGVSLVTIDASGLAFDDTMSPEVGSGYGGKMDSGMAAADMQTAMGLLAEETGGATIQGRNNLALALKGLEADWMAYYSLGYESPDAKPGAPRVLRVTVHRPGARVRTRRAVIERTTEQKVSDAVLSGAYIPHQTNPLRASLHIGNPKKSGSMWIVPLEFTIPFDRLTLVPEGGRAKGAVLFTAVSATPDGRISRVTTQRAPLDIPESQLGTLAGKMFTYSAALKVRAGPQTFSTALTDEVSHLSSFVQPHVVIPNGQKAKR